MDMDFDKSCSSTSEFSRIGGLSCTTNIAVADTKKKTENIEDDLILYKDLLNRYSPSGISIPTIQRCFKWGRKEVVEFLDKIYNSDGKFQYGLITVNKDGKVVDGQQRLTTISIVEKLIFNKNTNLRIDRYDCFLNEILEQLPKLKSPTMISYEETSEIICWYFEERRNIEETINKDVFECKMNNYLRFLLNEVGEEILSEFINLNKHKTKFQNYDLIRANQIILSKESSEYIAEVYEYIANKLYSDCEQTEVILKHSSFGVESNILNILYSSNKSEYYQIKIVKYLKETFLTLYEKPSGKYILQYLDKIMINSKSLFGEKLIISSDLKEGIKERTIMEVVLNIFNRTGTSLSLKNLVEVYPQYAPYFILPISRGKELTNIEKSFLNSELVTTNASNYGLYKELVKELEEIIYSEEEK